MANAVSSVIVTLPAMDTHCVRLTSAASSASASSRDSRLSRTSSDAASVAAVMAGCLVAMVRCSTWISTLKSAIAAMMKPAPAAARYISTNSPREVVM